MNISVSSRGDRPPGGQDEQAGSVQRETSKGIQEGVTPEAIPANLGSKGIIFTIKVIFKNVTLPRFLIRK